VHVVSQRAADMLGMGREGVRTIPVDGDYRMRMDALAEAIEQDRGSGIRPIGVIATAGTVATGAIDPLPEIADLCAARDLWFHVDAAYGGPAVLAEDLRPMFAGIERADSISFDPHKWLYTPHSGGCVLLRDWSNLVLSFAALASYVHEDKETSGHGIDLGMMGPQFSRGFQALKVWVSLLAHGRTAFARRISHDAELARYLAARVEAHPDFELMAPVTLSICCFRYAPSDLPDDPGREEYLNVLNERLMTEIQLDGRAFCSNAVLHEAFVLRACIVNFRTEADDVEAHARGRGRTGGAPGQGAPARDPARMSPRKGTASRSIGLLGSGEFEPWTEPVDRWLLERATGDGSVLILPTASAPEGTKVFDTWARMGRSHYRRLGVAAEALPVKTRDDANDPSFARRLEGTSMVFFSGGNPAYLARTLAGSAFWLAVLDAMDRGLAYAGCSAGIASLGPAAPDSMATIASEGERWQPGLGLFPNTWLAPHWNMLESFAPGITDFIESTVPRETRLMTIDERTAAVGDGRDWHVVGSGVVQVRTRGRWTKSGAGANFRAPMLTS